MKAYPRRFLSVFWWTLTCLTLTGLALLPGMLILRLEWAVPETLALLDARVMLAAAHALFAFITLLVLGALLPIHVRHGLKQHRNKRSGISLLIVLGVLILSGWGIYYIASERLSVWVSVSHMVVALIAMSVLALHVIMAKRGQTIQDNKMNPRRRQPAR